MMDPKSAAEELPSLYRELLDMIARIDASGQRALGYRLRTKATRIYSRAWDDRARRGLQELLRQASDTQESRVDHLLGTSRRSAPVA